MALICAGAAPSRPLKRWPDSKFAVLCQSLLERGLTPVLLGTEHEAAINARIAESVPGVHDLTGRTSFGQIVALAQKAELAVGNDTGPMHLIASTGCTSMVLFGPDSMPQRSRPHGRDVRWLQREDLAGLPVEQVLRGLSG